MHRFRTLPILLLVALFVLGACSDDDGGTDTGSSSGSSSDVGAAEDEGDADADTDADADEDDGGSGTTLMPQSDELDEDEAREAGNEAVYDRIAATEDCNELQDELDAHEENAQARRDGGDERRASILDAYADATRERMAERNCNGAGT